MYIMIDASGVFSLMLPLWVWTGEARQRLETMAQSTGSMGTYCPRHREEALSLARQTY